MTTGPISKIGAFSMAERENDEAGSKSDKPQTKAQRKSPGGPLGRQPTSNVYGSDYPACWLHHLNRPHDLSGK